MEKKILLVKTITLLYLSTLVKDNNYDIHSIVKKVLDAVKPPERSIAVELTYDVETQLRNLIVYMMVTTESSKFNEEDLKQRFQLICGDDENTFNALCSCLIEEGEEIDESAVNKRIADEYWGVRRILEKEMIGDVVKKWLNKMNWEPQNINYSTLINDISSDLSQFSSLIGASSDITDHKAVIAKVDFDDVQNVAKMLVLSKETMSSEGVIKTGFQGVNRMCGEPGGFRRGETLLIGALRHNYKSGFCRDIFIGTALFNVPYMKDSSKKPLNLRLSLEDEISTDIIELYRRIRQTVDLTFDRVSDIDPVEASQYIQEKLSHNGYHNVILAIDPTDFSIENIMALVEQYESKGYEIHHLNIDYLAMLVKNNNKSNTDMTSNYIQNLFTKLRNFCRRKSIFLSTPHQLGVDAKNLLKEGVSDFVKKVVGKSFYDNCKRIDQEVDMEITIHKEVINGVSYLSMARGKHRGVNTTPLVDQYCVYQFDPDLGLPYDYYGEDQSRRKLGGDTIAEGGDGPLWD